MTAGAEPAAAPPAVPSRRGTPLIRAALWIAAAGIVIASAVALRARAADVMALAGSLHPRWPLVALSCVAVLLNYALLVEVWRRVLVALGEHLAWRDAARIWFVSNLARYVPGALWQMGAMGVMAQRAGVSPPAAAAAALIVTLVNTITGLILAFATGAIGAAPGTAAVATLAIGLPLLAALPWMLPRVARAASRFFGRSTALPAVTHATVWLTAVATLGAWLVYGLAFATLDAAVLGKTATPLVPHVAAYTGSYLAGFLSIVTPAGLGVADGALAAMYVRFGLGTPSEAVVMAAVSRLWRTAMEVAPGAAIALVAASRAGRARSG